MKRLSFLLLCLPPLAAHAAFERLTQGGATPALGGASVALACDPWAAFSNPGALATATSRMLSLSTAPWPFGLKELARGSFSFVEPTWLGTLALSGSRFGFELYREITLMLSWGVTPLENIFIGVSVNYYSLTILRYGSAWTVGVDLGTLVQVSPHFRWGFSVLNVNASTLGRSHEELPQVYVTGLAYEPVPEAVVVLDMVKDIRFPVELRAGVQYTVFDTIALRGGLSTEPSTMNAGLGICYSFLQIDYALRVHSDLGPTHHFSVTLDLGE